MTQEIKALMVNMDNLDAEFFKCPEGNFPEKIYCITSTEPTNRVLHVAENLKEDFKDGYSPENIIWSSQTTFTYPNDEIELISNDMLIMALVYPDDLIRILKFIAGAANQPTIH